MIIPPPRMTSHPIDGPAIDDHVTGMAHVPHQHIIRESWEHEKKQRIAHHIETWHHNGDGKDWRSRECPKRGPALSHFAPEIGEGCLHCGWDGWPVEREHEHEGERGR